MPSGERTISRGKALSIRLTAYGLKFRAADVQPHGGRERVYRLENGWVMVRRRGQHLTVTVSGSVVREWPVKVYEDGHNRRPENPVLGGPTLRQAQWKATVEFLTRMVNERHSDDAQAQTMLKAARDSGWD